MYLHASSAVRVGNTTSTALPVQRGVAQGCPLSPLLYDIFADSLLDAVHDDVSDAGLRFDGVPGHSPAFLVGQSYADDMAGIASTAQGLQRVIDRIHAHSMEWQWDANTQKSVVMAFGDPALLASVQDERWFWGDVPLKRVSSVKYLGLHFHESGSWGEHIQQVAAKGHRVLGQWLPVLTSSSLPVSLKRKVIVSRLLPVLTYGMEVWSPLDSSRSETVALNPISDVIDKACRIAAGLHRTAGTRAWQKRTCVSKDVLMSDFHVLPLPIQLDLAHSRFGIRTRANDAQVLGQPAVDSPVSSQHRAPGAFFAPDVMGAVIRSHLDTHDSWLSRSKSLSQDHVECAKRVPLPDAAQVAAVSARLRDAAAVPVVSSHSCHGRRHHAVLPTVPHFNPVSEVLRQLSVPPYFSCTSPVAWPLLSFRSAYLPYTYTQHARQLFTQDNCPTCGEELVPASGTITAVERRWRHICHHIFACEATTCTLPYRPLQALLTDASEEAQRCDLPELAKVFTYFDGGDALQFSMAHLIPFLLDPIDFCSRYSTDSQVGKRMSRLATAFCLQAGAMLGNTPVHKEHIRALNLPPNSNLHTRVFPEDAFYPFPFPVSSSDSEDELTPPWISSDPRYCHGDSPALTPALQGHNPKPPACSMSGPVGLHEADARYAG